MEIFVGEATTSAEKDRIVREILAEQEGRGLHQRAGRRPAHVAGSRVQTSELPSALSALADGAHGVRQRGCCSPLHIG